MIKYQALCRTGLIRKNNEDNLYLNGEYLPLLHGDSQNYQGLVPEGIFGVFDGMGGEERGEAASYLAAKTLHQYAAGCLADESRSAARDIDERSASVFPDLTEICLHMNQAVVGHSRQEKLRFCGSTAALVSVKGDRADCVNVGDSRIYLYRDGLIKQISIDHCSEFLGRRTLTQCLGIPEEEFILSPYKVSLSLKKGDKILLCSDGITDMVPDEELCRLLAGADALSQIQGLVFLRGARDNYTGILLEKTD